MKTSDAGIFALAMHEGIVPGPYLDSGGVWTFGIGHTAAAGAPNPSRMPRGPSSDLARVFAVFRKDLAAYEAEVARTVTVDLEQHEFDALVSFHFNTGAIGEATFVKHLNAGNRQAAVEGFMDWRKPPEIVERRRAEQRLFDQGKYPDGRVPIWGVSEQGKIIWRQQSSLGMEEVIGFLRGSPSAFGTAPLGVNDRPVLRFGDQGAMVIDLQSQLKMVGQFPGKIDGKFGTLTFNAVTNVQASANIVMDGVVGPQTWAALRTAEPPPGRDVSADDLRARGSTTIKSADGIDLAAGAAALTATATAVSEAAEQADGLLPVLTRIITDHWPLLIVVALLAGAVILSGRIKAARVRDAETGANLSR